MNSTEWSFGCCEKGSGVYSCKPKDNPMYLYRETVTLGATTLTDYQVILSCHPKIRRLHLVVGRFIAKMVISAGI